MEGGAFVSRRDVERLGWALIKPGSRLYDTLSDEFAFNNSAWIDFDWIQKSIEYVNSLSQDERKLVYFYTYYGDDFVNGYMRGRLTEEDVDMILSRVIDSRTLSYIHEQLNHIRAASYAPRNILNSMPSYMTRLSNVIYSAPPTTKEIKVFRGMKNVNWNPDGTFIEEGFLSTTIHVPISSQFMGDSCCLLEITVRPGTPCVFIASASRKPGEFEVLFAPGMKVTMLRKREKLFVDLDESESVMTALTDPDSFDFRHYTVYESFI